VREAAIEALGEIADPQAIQPLIESLEDENVRGAASKALIKIGYPAIPDLRKAFSTANEQICLEMIYILGQIGDLEAFYALGEALKSEYSQVNRRAAKEFWNRGIEVVPILQKILMETYSENQKIFRELKKISRDRIKRSRKQSWVIDDFSYQNYLVAKSTKNNRAQIIIVDVLLSLLSISIDDIDNQELVSLKRLAQKTKNYKLLFAVTLLRESKECKSLNHSVWQDPLQPPPVPPWARAARRAGRGLALVFLAALLAVIGVLLAGAQDVLKEAVLPYLQSQPLAWVVLILVGAAAILVVAEWVRKKIVG
jgi:hypothetical protein